MFAKYELANCSNERGEFSAAVLHHQVVHRGPSAAISHRKQKAKKKKWFA